MTEPFQQRYLGLVSAMERDFRVSEWRWGDVDLWPLARMDLFLDMHWRHTGQTPPPRPPAWRRVLIPLATPLLNLWKSRRDLKHFAIRPSPADVIVLGDGVSLDLVDGAWQDRFGEPLIAACERRGDRAFIMQPGDLSRLPWRRKTFAANLVDLWSRIASRGAIEPAHLPDFDAVLDYLRRENIEAPSLRRAALERRAAYVANAAGLFERILKAVRPRLAFVVTYYAGLGPAFLLACRPQGILSVDLQHCPQDGAHKAYGWSHLPARGYDLLPAVFWTWTQSDAEAIESWASALAVPWHRAVHGGDTQMASFVGEAGETWARRFHDAAGDRCFAREILVALQPIAGQAETWEALADTIEASPSDWRWWIRRHPASRAHQDPIFGRLLALGRENVMIEEASALPLPALLPHMTALVSLMSGAAAEAAMFGVPALFLSPEARGPFSALIARGDARVIAPDQLRAEIQAQAGPGRNRSCPAQPALDQTLDRLEEIARDYAQLAKAPRLA